MSGVESANQVWLGLETPLLHTWSAQLNLIYDSILTSPDRLKGVEGGSRVDKSSEIKPWL